MRKLTGLLVFLFLGTTFSQTVTLRDTTNQYDYIIITVPEFAQSCEAFKQHKETVGGYNTLIVETAQIYAEFDTDSLPQNNIREFISFAGTYWTEPRPEFILFVGTPEQVPNFQLYSGFNPQPHEKTDYYFRINLNSVDTTEVSFLVGRVPAKSILQLQNYFSKVIEYETLDSVYSWMNNSLFLYENDLNFGFEEFCFELAGELPSYINSSYINNIDSSVSYGNKDTIVSRLNNTGAALVWFEGHGSRYYFINETYLSLYDLVELQNSSKYFVSIYVGSGCAIVDTLNNMTNELLFLENSGSIAGFASVSLTYWGATREINRIWAQKFFNSPDFAIGELLELSELSHVGTLYYQIQAINLWGDPSIKLKYDAPTSVQETQSEIVNGFELQQNYPNPFNPTTKIKFVVGDAYYASQAHVLLRVYDVLGNEVATLVNEQKPSGTYEVEFNANQLSSGVYFYKLQTGNVVETKKMLLLR